MTRPSSTPVPPVNLTPRPVTLGDVKALTAQAQRQLTNHLEQTPENLLIALIAQLTAN